jgi:mannose-6-phosphate isomerase class I
MMSTPPFRKTTQYLAPAIHTPMPEGTYDIYPAYPLGDGVISSGFDALAKAILATDQRCVVIDGYVGVMWDHFRQSLDAALHTNGIEAVWHCIDEALKPESDIDRMIAPYLGGDDPLFGTRSPLGARDFFSGEALGRIQPDDRASLNIVYGTGAALAGWEGPLFYLDVPKNEIQFRSRVGSVVNFGARSAFNAKVMYKRFYFVDWPALNRHRVKVLPTIDYFVDTQRPDEPTCMRGNDFRDGLRRMATTVFRPRPWFEPGPWGGQWMKAHIPQLSPDPPNYAWSFELIAPENGIAFSSSSFLLEASSDFLMFQNHREVLGDFADRFGYEFPIRYDFLDTFDGGNLSLQVHPRPEYIHRNFGETFTQDEAYYILDCKPGARVFLGFNAGVNPGEFRAALEQSFTSGSEVEVTKFVNTEEAHKHDLFLIPGGTVHCSGVDSLVLEISATAYIFTFKMYDWLRMDLDGKPRPLNIARAFENLYFERQGKRVKEEHVSHPELIMAEKDWKVFHLPTHPMHFYDVHRLEFVSTMDETTDGSCHVMSLVEGQSVTVETAEGFRQTFSYAETFVIPAATGRYRLINNGTGIAKIVKTFLKPDARPYAVPEGALKK